MKFKPTKQKSWSDSYQIIYYPTQIDPDYLKDMASKNQGHTQEIMREILKQGDPVLSASLSELKKSVHQFE